jgi:hypothetical protein
MLYLFICSLLPIANSNTMNFARQTKISVVNSHLMIYMLEFRIISFGCLTPKLVA